MGSWPQAPVAGSRGAVEEIYSFWIPFYGVWVCDARYFVSAGAVAQIRLSAPACQSPEALDR